ncbi:MAG: hypothetical protein ACI81W_003713 [Saprospiraceae bacterium]|jgi:hypothetical protein
MKYLTIKSIILASILISFTACDDFLDLEPETSLSSAVAFDNIQGIDAGINGVYSTLHSDWVERQIVFAECLAGNVKPVNPISNTNYTQALQHTTWLDLFNISNYFWQMSYSSLNIANRVVEALPDIESTNQQIEKNKIRLMGEAMYLRGLIHFTLNRFYAQPQNGLSVPILVQPFEPGDMPARASIDDIKVQVIADLKEAENLMADVVGNNGRADIWAVRALLARVYFEYRDYQNAESYANMVIENGGFSLIDGEVAAAFSTNISSENIFTFIGIPTDRAATNLFDIFSLNNANVQLSVSDSYWEIINENANDLRLTILHEDFVSARACHKYDNRDMNIPFIRLPEMYLIRAESRTNNGDLDGGLEDLNRLRQRAGIDDTTYTDKEDLLYKILIDRSLELSMEGDNFHNLKRLEQPIGGYPWSEAQFKLVFFIPETEVQLSSNIVQNDTW